MKCVKWYEWRVSAACVCVLGLLLSCTAGAWAQEEAQGVPPRAERVVFLPAHRLASMIRSGEISSTEALEAYLAQIHRHNGALNAIVTLDEEGARKRAREADEALSRGIVWGPLHGVPVTVKDNYATKGMRTTSSHPPLAGFVPGFDATAVARVREAGAIIIGKTNMPALGMDLQTRSPVFGVTSNPWDLERTPGGSTGGGAAAVAAGMSALCLGNDIGGSIRLPSHFCGIYGLKPTENLVPSYGLTPGPDDGKADGVRTVRHLASCGPLARSVDDLVLALKVMAGPDPREPDVPAVCMDEPPARAIQDLRIAWTDSLGGVPVDQETRLAIEAFMGRLARAGCTVERAEPADFDIWEVWKAYGEIMDMELGSQDSRLSRFLNFLFGWTYRKDAPMIRLVYPVTFGAYQESLTRRDALCASLETFLGQWDAWIVPVSSTPAFRHLEPTGHFGQYPVYYTRGIEVDGREIGYLAANTSYTSIFNLTGSPVVVMPVGRTPGGLPIGVQVVGKRWRDMELLSVARVLDQAAGAFQAPPGY
ncbi:MAG: amidase [Desulfomonilia bacterium]|jgi:amidase